MGLSGLRRGRAMRAAFVLAMLALAGGTLVGPTSVGAETAVATTVPFDTVEDNTCTNEMVALTGNVHFLIGGTISGGGMTQSHLQANLQGVTGVGLVTGAKYAAQDTSSQTFVFDNDLAPFHMKYEETAHLIRQGEVLNADDFYLHMVALATVNANGTVTVEDLKFDSYCQ
jgi:hypothetical protein